MNNWLNRLVLQSNGRPYTADEAERIAEYAESLPDRLAAANKLDESQKWLVKQLADAVADRAEEWGLPREPLVADFAAGLASVAHAMLLDDPAVLDDTVVAPTRGLARALDVPAEELGELFPLAWGLLSKRLDARSAALLAPHFAWCGSALTGSDAAALIETPAPVEV